MGADIAAFAATLTPARGVALDHGDIAWERVPYGRRPEDVHYKKWRILKIEGGTVATCVHPDGKKLGNGEKKKIFLRDLWVEKTKEQEEVPKQPTNPVLRALPTSAAYIPPRPTPQPAPVVAQQQRAPSVDEDFEAWQQMSLAMLGNIDAEICDLTEKHGTMASSLEQVDATHRARIEELEAELVAAKRAHAEERALFATRREALHAKIVSAQKRRAHIANAVEKV